MPALKFEDNGNPHVHQYVRKGVGRSSKFYRCAHPRCTHFMLKADLKGKETLCAVCSRNKFLLTSEDLKIAKPRCPECSNTKQAEQIRQNKRILENLLKI